MSDRSKRMATAFASASVGNVAVGFDILGFAMEAPGDRVSVEVLDEPQVEISEISGVVTDLPMAATDNTATVGLLEMIDDLKLDFGFRVAIEKGIPLGSGMGGSAASAVASVVAANELLDQELSRNQCLRYALIGESAATGDLHADNVTPCLFGGLTLTRSIEPVEVLRIPVPDEIRCVLAYPNRRVDTRRAREVVPDELPVSDFVAQSANLASFITGCHRGDLELIGRSLKDVLIEPHRASLIPGFYEVCEAARAAGALGSSISGAGPTIFAWVTAGDLEAVASAMHGAFAEAGSEATIWSGAIGEKGARIIDEGS